MISPEQKKEIPPFRRPSGSGKHRSGVWGHHPPVIASKDFNRAKKTHNGSREIIETNAPWGSGVP